VLRNTTPEALNLIASSKLSVPMLTSRVFHILLVANKTNISVIDLKESLANNVKSVKNW